MIERSPLLTIEAPATVPLLVPVNTIDAGRRSCAAWRGSRRRKTLLPFTRGAIRPPAGWWPDVDEARLRKVSAKSARFAAASLAVVR